MPALTGNPIQDTYIDLIQISNSNAGADSTLRQVSDGGGDDTALQLSTTKVAFGSGSTVIEAYHSTNGIIESKQGSLDLKATNGNVVLSPTSGNLVLKYNGSTDRVLYGDAFPMTFALGIGESVTTGTNKTNELVAMHSGTIGKVWIRAKTAPSGSALICDVNKNGTSIWASTQANRIQLASTVQDNTQTSFDTATVTEGDVFSIDIDQIGSGVAGSGVTVQVLVYG